MSRLTGEPLRWLQDFQDCLAGEKGVVMLAEAERFLTWAPEPHGWQAWREFRQTIGEQPFTEDGEAS